MEVCTIGGYEYVGNNMTAVKVEDDVFIFDSGVNIPSLIEMQGDENPYVHNEQKLRKFKAIPNDLVLDNLKWKENVRAIIISHAHLDHLGAIPWIAYRYPNALIIGTDFSIALLKTIASDENLILKNKIIAVKENSSYLIPGKKSKYKIDFVRATHSTIQCSFLALHTPEGAFFYALDFKMDDFPVIGSPPDYNKLKSIGKKGVKVLAVNSLYSGSKGRTASEIEARTKLKKAMNSVRNNNSAFFISTFSSHIARLKSIVDFGKRTNRKIIVLGRSMDKYINCAIKANMCPFRNQIKVAKFGRHVNSTLKEIEKNRGKYIVVCTGHQAEPGSVLDRITKGKTNFKFRKGDNLIFSSKIIPVKENLEARNKMDTALRSKGVIIQDNIHVSGHGSEEDIKMLINMIKPKNIIPTHGTPEQEKPAVNIAEKLGYKYGENVLLSQDGKVLKF